MKAYDAPITFRNVPPSEALLEYVKKKLAKLDALYSNMTTCRVVVDSPHRSQRHGKHYRVHIEMGVPGRLLVCDRDPDESQEHEDAYAAIDDAFDDAQRLLDDFLSRKQSLTSRERGRGLSAAR